MFCPSPPLAPTLSPPPSPQFWIPASPHVFKAAATAAGATDTIPQTPASGSPCMSSTAPPLPRTSQHITDLIPNQSSIGKKNVPDWLMPAATCLEASFPEQQPHSKTGPCWERRHGQEGLWAQFLATMRGTEARCGKLRPCAVLPMGGPLLP